MYSPPARSVRTMLLHGLKPVWSLSTVPPKIQKPLSAAIKCPATDANGAKSHSENSSRRKRSFTATLPDPRWGTIRCPWFSRRTEILKFVYWLAPAEIYRGWARSASGDTAEGISWIEQG